MTPQQREALPDALRDQLVVAARHDLKPTAEMVRITEAANGSGDWLVLGCWIDSGGDEALLRTAVDPQGDVGETELLDPTW